MDDRLVELFAGNPDSGAMLFCADVLRKEDAVIKPYLSHLFIMDGYVWGTSGTTIRRAKLSGDYEDGLYRVFRKDKKGSVIIYLAEDESAFSYPHTSEIFVYPEPPLGQITVTEAYWHAHAEIVQLLSARRTFDASMLKGAQGVYDLLYKDQLIILDNGEFSIAIAPMTTQQPLPGM